MENVGQVTARSSGESRSAFSVLEKRRHFRHKNFSRKKVFAEKMSNWSSMCLWPKKRRVGKNAGVFRGL